jgi:hypothetical protein
MKREFLYIIGLVLCFILLFLCFNVLNHKIETNQIYNIEQHNIISRNIDSLETELNIFYKTKQDTIIINVVPADIKIYPKIYNH